jgi:predicted dehydrogenase
VNILKDVKVVQVGLGYVAQAEWLPFVPRLPGMELVAVVDQIETLANYIGNKLHVEHFTDLDECFKKCDVDAVLITTPTITHADLIIQSANHGKDVLVEKPLTEYIPDAKKCVEVSKKAGIKLMVGYMRNYDSDCLKVKELLNNNEIGEINTAISWVNHTYPSVYTPFIPAKDRGQPLGTGARRSAARRVWGMTVHHTNLLRFWLGDYGKVLFGRSSNGYAPFMTVFEIGDGITATHQTFDSSGQGEHLWLHGEKGHINANLWSPHMPYKFPRTTLFNKKQKTECELVFPHKNMYEEQIKHFIECIREDKQPITTGEDSIKDLDFSKAIIEKMGLKPPEKGKYEN